MQIHTNPRLAYRALYRSLENAKVWYDQVYYFKARFEFALTLWFPSGERYRITMKSYDKDIAEFVEYIRLQLLHEFDIDIDQPPEKPNTWNEELDIFIAGLQWSEPKVWTKKRATKPVESELVREIQKVHKRLTESEIMNLIRDYSRSEILKGKYIGGIFVPADLYHPHPEETDALNCIQH